MASTSTASFPFHDLNVASTQCWSWQLDSSQEHRLVCVCTRRHLINHTFSIVSLEAIPALSLQG